MSIKIRDYTSLENWRTGNASKVAAFTREGIQYFLKEYGFIWPEESACQAYPALKKQYEDCEAVYKRLLRINNQLKRAGRGSDNLVLAKEIFREGNKLYKAAEYVDFLDLPAQDIHDVLTVEEIDEIMINVLEALGTLHRFGIIHADIKPENILILKSRKRAKLIDFDDSFYVDEKPGGEDLVGTFDYYSPEVARYIKMHGTPDSAEAKAITFASDIFSAGLVWYMYLTGEMPRIPAGCRYVYEALLKGKKITLSNKLDPVHKRVLARMLDVDPARRYSSCTEVLADFRHTAVPNEGLITVHVVDHMDRPIANSVVYVGNLKTKEIKKVMTAEDGTAKVRMMPGEYSVSALGEPGHKVILNKGSEVTLRFVFKGHEKVKTKEFDPPLNGIYQAITEREDGTYELHKINGRFMTANRSALAALGIDPKVLA